MVEGPVLRSAPTDGDGPAKRKRRPALSCVECRVRKVRCDRNKPCGACTRIESATCTYRPHRMGICSPGSPSAAARSSRNQDYEVVPRSYTKPLDTYSENDVTITRFAQTRHPGESNCSTHDAFTVDKPISDPSSYSDAGSTSIVSSLLDRINVLESKLTATHVGDRSQGGNWEGSSPVAGRFIKSKFYGRTHWMNAMAPYDGLGHANTTVNTNTNRTEVTTTSEMYNAVSRIKRMARIIKSSRMLHPTPLLEVQDSIPPRTICDQLVDGYLRTFEGVYRVLHVPSFRREYEAYWTGTAPAKLSVTLKILLVCAIGVPFYVGPDQPRLRVAAAKWTQVAESWQSAPHAKSRLNMSGLQIMILTILARQICGIDGDHIWIPAGSLLRTSMLLGLHRDPSNFKKISIYHAEMRRRLWATTLEITVQSSLDMGMPPMISAKDYDTSSPANVNDEDMGEGNEAPLSRKPPTIFTESSIQIAFTQTLPIRLEIVRLLNSLRLESSYKDIIRLGSELTRACREKTLFLKAAQAANCNITPFQIKLSDVLVRRFILCMHRPFFAKANEDPQYHYSRKVCLDTSLAVLAPAAELRHGEEDDWVRLTHRCVGFYKSFVLFAISTVCSELNTLVKERREDLALFAPHVSNTSTPSVQLKTAFPQFYILRDVLETAYVTSKARLRNGETNAKGAIFLASALARLDALMSGADADHAALVAAKQAISETTGILREVYREEHGVDIDLKLTAGPFAGRDYGRGEGADDVTGQTMRTGTGVNDDAKTASPSFDGSMLSQYELNASMILDLDFSDHLQGQSISTDSEYHFEGNSDWLYDLSGWTTIGGLGLGYS